jgi:hypothetical protein
MSGFIDFLHIFSRTVRFFAGVFIVLGTLSPLHAENCWTPWRTSGRMQFIDGAIPGCFPTANATFDVMIAKLSEVDHGCYSGYDGYCWSYKYGKIPGEPPFTCQEPVSPGEGAVAYCGYGNAPNPVYTSGLWFSARLAHSCTDDSKWDSVLGACAKTVAAINIAPESEICTAAQAGAQAGHPIIPATGEKVLPQTDFEGSGPSALSFTRHYRSSRVVGATTGAATAGLGQAWSHNHAASVQQTGLAGTGRHPLQ